MLSQEGQPMSSGTSVIAIVEGKTELDFISRIVAPYLGWKGVYITPIQVYKPGSRGGDVKFSRVIKDIRAELNKRPDTVITTFLDLYGLQEWPDLPAIMATPNYDNMIEKLYESTDKALREIFKAHHVDTRIIPYFAIYEFEALLFADPAKLATGLDCSTETVTQIVKGCGGAELINNSPDTAPSKRLDKLSPRGKFRKTTQGIAIAESIGIDTMREKCPQFNNWLNQLEAL